MRKKYMRKQKTTKMKRAKENQGENKKGDNCKTANLEWLDSVSFMIAVNRQIRIEECVLNELMTFKKSP